MLTALVGAGGLLLLAAGAAKVVDPSRTAGALRALGAPVAPVVVRVGAVVEAAIGAAAVVVGGRVPAGLVGASFAAFAGFVAVALRSDRPIGSCGCFGRADTSPRGVHVVVDLAFAAAGLVAASTGVAPLLDAPLPTVAAAVLLAGGAYVVLISTHERRATT